MQGHVSYQGSAIQEFGGPELLGGTEHPMSPMLAPSGLPERANSVTCNLNRVTSRRVPQLSELTLASVGLSRHGHPGLHGLALTDSI